MRRWLVPVFLLGIIFLLAYGLVSPRKDPPSATLGTKAPDFNLLDTAGKKYSVADYKGKVIVINFWASWCEPCRGEAPILAKVSKDYKDVIFLGMLYNDAKENAIKFNSSHSILYPIIIDSDLKAAIEYGVGQIPITYIIDKSGKISYTKLGPFESESELINILNNIRTKS